MKDSLRDRIAKDTLWYTLSVYIAQFLGIFSGLASRKFLGPEDMGLWVLLQTFMTFGLFSEMGILTAMYCKIPVFVGQKDAEQVRQTQNAAFTFAFTGVIGVAFLFIGYGLFAGHESPKIFLGSVAMAALTILTCIYNFYILCSWALNRFKALALTVILNAVLTLVLVFLFVRPWGFYGSCAYTLIVTLISVVTLSNALKISPSFLWDWKRIKDLLWFGFPVFAGGMIFVFFLTVDRMIITRFFDSRALGYYSITMIVFSLSSTAPKMLSIVLFPKMQEEYAASGDLDKIMQMVVKPDLAIAFFSPLLLGSVYFFVPTVVTQILPKFTPGILSAQVLLLGGFFISLVYNAQSFLIAVDKRMHSIPFVLCSILVLYAVSRCLIRLGYGIEGVAAGASVAFFTYFVSLTFYVLNHRLNYAKMAAYYVPIITVFLYFLFWIWWIGAHVYPGGPWMGSSIKTILLTVVSVPIFYLGDRKTHAIRYGFYLIAQRLGRRETERATR